MPRLWGAAGRCICGAASRPTVAVSYPTLTPPDLTGTITIAVIVAYVRGVWAGYEGMVGVRYGRYVAR